MVKLSNYFYQENFSRKDSSKQLRWLHQSVFVDVHQHKRQLSLLKLVNLQVKERAVLVMVAMMLA